MISSIRLQQFRSYQDESFEFEPGVNIIVGPNGSGKTNLLESIEVQARGSSYRASDDELIGFENNWARIDASVGEDFRTIKIRRETSGTKKDYIFEEKPYKLLTLKHSLPVVLFEPNNLQLLHGQPDMRRSYLDTLLEQTQPHYAGIRKQYRRVLFQRNSLLKRQHSATSEQFFVWNLRLSELGGAIAAARTALISDIQAEFAELYNHIAGAKKTKVSIRYVSKIPIDNYETTLLRALEQSLDQDKVRGFTSYGPHRDDFKTLLNGREASSVASRGESRTALLALKVFELGQLEKARGIKPLLLLDDVFSELDGKRRHALASFLHTHQTFITTTDADLVLDTHMQASNIIALSQG